MIRKKMLYVAIPVVTSIIIVSFYNSTIGNYEKVKNDFMSSFQVGVQANTTPGDLVTQPNEYYVAGEHYDLLSDESYREEQRIKEAVSTYWSTTTEESQKKLDLADQEKYKITDEEFKESAMKTQNLVEYVPEVEKVVYAELDESEITYEQVDQNLELNKSELDSLERIVQAEAGSEGLIGKILVANVILNRVNSEYFPDDIVKVIEQRKGNIFQFSPVQDGAYYVVTVTKETKKAVEMALAGIDYSKGVEFFCTPASAGGFHDVALEFAFKYKGHNFYWR